MKQVRGIWLPDSDTHFQAQLGPMVGGKATYQLRKYQAALKRCERRRHAIDIGSHVGLWSRVMKRDFMWITAFEPIPELRECFRKNIDAEGGWEILPFAVGSKSESVRVGAVDGNSGNAHVVGDGGISVRCVTLDHCRPENVDLIKIDVEGYELDVILGAEETIRRDNPVMVVEQKPGHAERYGKGQHDAVKLLKSWGMKEAEVISGDHIMVW